MGLGTYLDKKWFGQDEEAKRKREMEYAAQLQSRAQREREVPGIVNELIGIGLGAEEINPTVRDYVENGSFKLPTRRIAQTEGPPTEEGYLPSIQEPIRYGKKPKRFFYQDEAGQYSEVPIPEGAGRDYEPEFLKSGQGPEDGYTIYVDQQGQEVRREPNGRRYNTVVKIGGGASPALKDPRRAVYDKYFSVASDPKKASSLPQEMMQTALDYAHDYGLDTHEVDVETPRAGVKAMAARAADWAIPGDRGWGKEKSKVEVLGSGPGAPRQRPTTRTDFESAGEALSSGLPEGTIVTIKGKRFRLAR